MVWCSCPKDDTAHDNNDNERNSETVNHKNNQLPLVTSSDNPAHCLVVGHSKISKIFSVPNACLIESGKIH